MIKKIRKILTINKWINKTGHNSLLHFLVYLSATEGLPDENRFALKSSENKRKSEKLSWPFLHTLCKVPGFHTGSDHYQIMKSLRIRWPLSEYWISNLIWWQVSVERGTTNITAKKRVLFVYVQNQLSAHIRIIYSTNLAGYQKKTAFTLISFSCSVSYWFVHSY